MSGTAQEIIDALEWGTGTLDNSDPVLVYFIPGGHTWNEDEDGDGSIDATYTSAGWTAYETQQVMLGFEQWSNVADIQFEITTDRNAADLLLGNTTGTGVLGYFYPPGYGATAGTGVFDYGGQGWDWNNPGNGLEQGGYGFITVIHEIGHGIGLAHPHDGGGNSTSLPGVSSAFGDYGDYDLNQGIYTTMSYNDGWATGPFGASSSDNYGWQGTPMALDIAVIQEIYGANTTYANGDDVYYLPIYNGSGTFYSSIWDTGGTDWIINPGGGNTVINLNPASLQLEEGGGGYVSYTDGIHGGFTIANGVVIENAQGGSGSDTIIGNDADNILNGGAGDDEIDGGAGDDQIEGGAGADTLNGEAGDDFFFGGDGADIIDGGDGVDFLYFPDATTGATIDLSTPSQNTGQAAGDQFIDVEIIGGTPHADVLNGDADDNQLRGGPGDDAVNGGDGDDALSGNAGQDTITGGAGNDSIGGHEGNDTLFGGNGADSLLGGTGDDALHGDDGGDRLDGGQGNDTLIGGGGHDHVFDAMGNDTLQGEEGADALTALSGINLLQGGAGSDLLTGGIQADRIEGGDGDDVLVGDFSNVFLGGSDELVGGAGNDSLTGGIGADDFIFAPGDGNDIIAEFDLSNVNYPATGADFTQGADQIVLDGFSSVNAGNVETLISEGGGNSVFSAEGTTITIYGVTGLTADDFVFV